MKNKTWYTLHRWAALVAGLQLGAWTLSGLAFTLLDLERVRGRTNAAHPVWQLKLRQDFPETGAVHLFEERFGVGPQSVRWQAGALGTYLILERGDHVLRFDLDGQESPVSMAQAADAARVAHVAKPAVLEVTRVEAAGVVPLEYRDKPLPAWRVVLMDADETVTYVHAITGDVTAQRNRWWRWFDWFWAVHIMDYSGRENFNHWVIRFFAALGQLTVLTGTVLWGRRTLGGRRRGTT